MTHIHAACRHVAAKLNKKYCALARAGFMVAQLNTVIAQAQSTALQVNITIHLEARQAPYVPNDAFAFLPSSVISVQSYNYQYKDSRCVFRWASEKE